MSTTEDLSQVTELSYQTIESNLIWELKITEASTFSSRKVKLPFINGEWYLTVQNTTHGALLTFDLDIFEDHEVEPLRDPHPKEDQYCFDFYIDGVSGKEDANFEDISDEIQEEHDMCLDEKKESYTIDAKVTIKIYQKFIRKLIDFENNLNELYEDFGNLFSDSIHSDCTIIVKSKEFKVHKSVLSARSHVFKIMFLSKMKDAADSKVDITDVEPSTFEQLLIFIYSGKIPEDLDYYAMDLFVASDKYGIKHLRNECEKHISQNISKDNAMAVFKLATLYTCHYDLKQMSFEIIKEKLQKTSIVGNYAATLDCTTLEQLLEIKKSFDSLLNETFKSIEGSEET